MNHRLILTLGTNVSPEYHLRLALNELMEWMTLRLRSRTIYNEPIDFSYPSDWFANVLIVADTRHDLATIQGVCKAIEQRLGRTQAHKQRTPQIVSMDIDLIVWDKQILKPKDLERAYVHRALEALSMTLEDLMMLGFETC